MSVVEGAVLSREFYARPAVVVGASYWESTWCVALAAASRRS